MPHFGDVSQMLSLKMRRMPLTIGFPLTLVIGEHSKHFDVVGFFLKSIVSFIIDSFQMINSLIDFTLKSTNTPRTLTFSPHGMLGLHRIHAQPL